MLPAIGYLHDHGLIYCDFKPDNVIHEGGAVKLIDLGGVRRWDGTDAAIFGTVGYQAAEVPGRDRPSPRPLHGGSCPGGAHPRLAGLDDDRRRAPTRPPPPRCWSSTIASGGSSNACAPRHRRFRDADEMADALHGVLCQVAAAVDDIRVPRLPRSPPPRLDLGWQALPSPLMPNHPAVANRVAGVAEETPRRWHGAGSTRN